MLPELLCVLEDRSLRCSALHSTSDGEIKDIFALAVSFWTRPLLASGGRLSGRLSILPHHCISLPHAGGWKPGLGTGLGAARPGAPPASPLDQGSA